MYISQLVQYFRACGSYHDFLDRGLLLQKATEPKVPIVQAGSYSFESFMDATMTWLRLRNICVTNDHGYVPYVVSTSRFFSHL